MQIWCLLVISLAAAETCPKNSSSFFYIVDSDFQGPACSNMYSLVTSSLLVSSSSINNLNSVAEATAGDMNWLVRCGQPVGLALQGNYSLLTFSPNQLSDVERSVLYCPKQEVSFKRAFAPKKLMPTARKWNITTSADKDAFVESISEFDYIGLLSSLSGATPLPVNPPLTIKTRYTGTQANRDAADWIGAYFDQHELNSYTQTYSVPQRGTSYNVIGEKIGHTKPGEIIVIGAHYDSTSQQPATLAPGAVDNGSGAAGVMVLAAASRLMDFSRTVEFIVFGGEEQGLYGSYHYVQEATREGKNIVGALIMDMIGYSNRYYGVKIEGTRDPAIQELMQLYDSNVRAYTTLTRVQSTNSFGSDHVSFQEAGYASFFGNRARRHGLSCISSHDGRDYQCEQGSER